MCKCLRDFNPDSINAFKYLINVTFRYKVRKISKMAFAKEKVTDICIEKFL